MTAKPTQPDEFEYITRDDVNIAILREISKLHFRERLRRVVPLVAKELVAAGVDFSRVDFSKISEPTDNDLDGIYEDLM